MRAVRTNVRFRISHLPCKMADTSQSSFLRFLVMKWHFRQTLLQCIHDDPRLFTTVRLKRVSSQVCHISFVKPFVHVISEFVLYKKGYNLQNHRLVSKDIFLIPPLQKFHTTPWKSGYCFRRMIRRYHAQPRLRFVRRRRICCRRWCRNCSWNSTSTGVCREVLCIGNGVMLSRVSACWYIILSHHRRGKDIQTLIWESKRSMWIIRITKYRWRINVPMSPCAYTLYWQCTTVCTYI